MNLLYSLEVLFNHGKWEEGVPGVSDLGSRIISVSESLLRPFSTSSTFDKLWWFNSVTSLLFIHSLRCHGLVCGQKTYICTDDEIKTKNLECIYNVHRSGLDFGMFLPLKPFTSRSNRFNCIMIQWCDGVERL